MTDADIQWGQRLREIHENNERRKLEAAQGGITDPEQAALDVDYLLRWNALREADHASEAGYTARLKATFSGLAQRLRYAELQLTKEAKFKPRRLSENNRFYRAYDRVSEIREALENQGR